MCDSAGSGGPCSGISKLFKAAADINTCRTDSQCNLCSMFVNMQMLTMRPYPHAQILEGRLGELAASAMSA